MINSFANIITALGTIGLATIAWLALHTWRKEFIGKKKIELAAEIVAGVFKFQNVLIQARVPVHTPQEIDEVKKWLEEVNLKKQNIPNSLAWPIYSDRLHHLTPIHRLNKSADITDNFAELLDKSLMYWPEDLFRRLVELHSFLGKIRYASEMLYEKPNVREYWDTAFEDNTTDNKTTKRIFEIGDEIKQNLEPLYRDKQIPWKKLSKPKNP